MAETLSVLGRLGCAFDRCGVLSFCLGPLRVKCFECLLRGKDVVAVLPTDFGGSLLLARGRISDPWRLFCGRVSVRAARRVSRGALAKEKR